MAAAGAKLISVEFEVFGRVQGVFFRKYTQETAQQHNLVGWCKNTHSGTVLGIVQGPKNKADLIKHWLRNTGSPKSRITDCQFKNEKEIDKCDFKEFQIVRPAKKKRKP